MSIYNSINNPITRKKFADHTPLPIRVDYYCKYDPDMGCLVWTGGRTDGYGSIRYRGKTIRTHRYQYERHNGPIPEGLCVRHTCHNGQRGCITPEHLILGTWKDNKWDSIKVDRHTRGERSNKSTLTDNKVRTIKLLALTGLKDHQIAVRYGVHRTAISDIRRRISWRHLL